MRVLIAGVYFDSGSVSLAGHTCFAEVDGHSSSEVVGGAVVTSSAVMAAWVGSEVVVDSVEVACFLDSYYLGNLSSGDP